MSGFLKSRAVRNRSKLAKRHLALEPLEGRTLMTYTFSYTSTTAASVTESGGSDSFTVVNNGFGNLEWSTDGGATFSTDWDGSTSGIQTLSASSATLSITLGADNSAIHIGTATSGTTSASEIQSALTVNAFAGNTNDSLTVNDANSTLGAGTYSYNGTAHTITGPLSDINITESSTPFAGGTTLTGSAAANIFNVVQTITSGSAGEPLTLVGGAGNDTANIKGTSLNAPVNVNLGGGTNTVNVGNAGSLGGIAGKVIVTGTAAVNIDDSADTTAELVTFDNLSTNVNAPYEVFGTSAAIEYGPSITAVTYSGGTDASLGTEYRVNFTQANTPVTITGGANQNTFYIGNTVGGLADVLGGVTIHGGSSDSDLVTLRDATVNATNSYTVTSTTVTSSSAFAGLTYDDNIGTLTLNAESGNKTINVNSTANGVINYINGGGGVDLINVNGTGTPGTRSGVTNVSTAATAGSTINVVANSEPVNVGFGDASNTDVVNIGSTVGAGTLAGILSTIAIDSDEALYTLNFHDENDTTAHTWTLANDDTGDTASVALSGGIGTTSYQPSQLATPLTLNGGSGGNTFNVDNTTSDANGTSPVAVNTVINTGTGADDVNVFKTGTNTLDIHGQDGQDTVVLGAYAGDGSKGMQQLHGHIQVDNASGGTHLYLDDSLNTASGAELLANDGTTGTVTGICAATITYTDDNSSELDGVNYMAVYGSQDSNVFTVTGTLPNASTDLYTGVSNDTTNVEGVASASTLNIHGQNGNDVVNITDNGSVSGILGNIVVDNTLEFTRIVVDASADTGDHASMLLNSFDGQSRLRGLFASSSLYYTTTDISTVTLDTAEAGTQALGIDFAGGNPIPTETTPGLIFNAGATSSSVGDSHKLYLYNSNSTPSVFQSEVHNAQDPSLMPAPGHYGTINFVDANSVASGLEYTGLQPIDDQVPATTYTFNDFGYPDQSFSATDTTLTGGVPGILFASTPQTPFNPTNFEATGVANKADIIFNTPAQTNGATGSVGLNGVVDLPTAYTGLESLAFNTNTNADNQVSFVNVPLHVETFLNGGADEDATTVTGQGIPAATGLVVTGGPAQNTLTYDAGGLTPGVNPIEGGFQITLPGFGAVFAFGYQNINLINVPTPTITPGTAATINGVEGGPLVNVVVGTFTFPLADIIPNPAGLPASDFLASIDWGDSDPAGYIVQDASNPSVYDILGTNTYAEPGTYTVTNSVSFLGGTYSTTFDGTVISVILNASEPVNGADATASIVPGSITVSALPLLGVEGNTIAAAPIASFLDLGGASGNADPASDFSANITIYNNTGGTVLSVAAASISQLFGTNSYTVNAPALSLSGVEAGNYTVVVTVTKTANTIHAVGSGGSTLVVSDAALSLANTFSPNPGTGVHFSSPLGTFNDGNPARR